MCATPCHRGISFALLRLATDETQMKHGGAIPIRVPSVAPTCVDGSGAQALVTAGCSIG